MVIEGETHSNAVVSIKKNKNVLKINIIITIS